MVRLVENWLIHTPEGRNWLEEMGFVNKEAMVQVIAQIESNLAQSNRDLLTKIQTLKSYVEAKGSDGDEETTTPQSPSQGNGAADS